MYIRRVRHWRVLSSTTVHSHHHEPCFLALRRVAERGCNGCRHADATRCSAAVLRSYAAAWVIAQHNTTLQMLPSSALASAGWGEGEFACRTCFVSLLGAVLHTV